MTIPEQYTYHPAPGGWPPQQGGWPPQYQQMPPPPPPRRRGPIIAAVAGGLAIILGAAGVGFAAGWTLHTSDSSSQSSYLPLNPDAGQQQGGDPFGQGQQHCAAPAPPVNNRRGPVHDLGVAHPPEATSAPPAPERVPADAQDSISWLLVSRRTYVVDVVGLARKGGIR